VGSAKPERLALVALGILLHHGLQEIQVTNMMNNPVYENIYICAKTRVFIDYICKSGSVTDCTVLPYGALRQTQLIDGHAI